jgi:AcrR family transcriptional regulator
MARVGLTPAAVVAHAGDVADAHGLPGVTLAAVAKRCGVAQPSLYKHVDGLDDVRRRLAITSTQALTAAMTHAAVGRSGDDAVRSLAHAYRDYALRHPGRYAATIRAPHRDDAEHGAAAEAAARTVFAVLGGYGLAGEELVHATRALRSALHGFVALEAAGGFGMPEDVDESFDRMLAMLLTALGGSPARDRPRR